MSTVKIEFEGPDGSGYAVEMNDFHTYAFDSTGEELIDQAVCVIKRAAGLTND